MEKKCGNIESTFQIRPCVAFIYKGADRESEAELAPQIWSQSVHSQACNQRWKKFSNMSFPFPKSVGNLLDAFLHIFESQVHCYQKFELQVEGLNLHQIQVHIPQEETQGYEEKNQNWHLAFSFSLGLIISPFFLAKCLVVSSIFLQFFFPFA